MKNKLTIIFASLFVLILSGCAATPHVFVSEYTPEELPIAESIVGDMTLTGSAFLRQGGGGVVSCAGNTVKLSRAFSFERSDYATEVNSLSYGVRNVSEIDQRHIDFEAQLDRIKASMVRTTSCDVDGKFEFKNLAPGYYNLRTKVYWVVADQGQGGIVGTNVYLDGMSGNTQSVVINDVVRYCSFIFFPCNV